MRKFYRKFLKRLFDVVAALILLGLTAPLTLIIAIAVLLSLGRPMLFQQARPGRNGQLFILRKFRTMHLPNEQLRRTTDETRMTHFGKFLRETSLDELPELLNVLRGEMSLVGPRPLLAEYLQLYSSTQNMRHEVRPGLTGLAQVSGRNSLSWDEKLELDVQYVRNYSLWLDVKILIKTVGIVLSRKGITSVHHVTSLPFEG